ncbi:hypothetical protein AB1Y20_005412 [Prymnesium parvum]|uniref:Uncharacterized protein n=1 Tax=Prymnesium parvum TaxID=97485 RepID=A0AB34J6G1_PRYPA
MSATSDREVAVKYAGECKPSMLFEIEQGMADRAAALKWLSQYPHENELCFPPLCGLEVKVEEDEARTPMTRWDWLKEEKTCFIVRLRACVREVREPWSAASSSVINFMQLLKFCAEEKAKEMAAAVKQKLSMRTFDGELESYVSVLRSHKSYVPALCGTPWCDWSAPGSCQVCNTDVDCAEKGLHCEAGGHRICWACMVAKIEWHRMDPLELLTTSDDPGLLNRICHECGSEAATTDGYVWIDQEPAPL